MEATFPSARWPRWPTARQRPAPSRSGPLGPAGGATWVELRLTPQSFSSADAEWPGFEQFLGDYVSLAVIGDGDEVLAVYPTTEDGDLDVYARRIVRTGIFADGFESGDLSAW